MLTRVTTSVAVGVLAIVLTLDASMEEFTELVSLSSAGVPADRERRESRRIRPRSCDRLRGLQGLDAAAVGD
jgi:hypothetical protein